MFTPRYPLLFLAAYLCAAALPASAEIQLGLSALGVATQSGGSSAPNPAALAIDGSDVTFSETPDATNSFWEVELGRAVRISKIELVAPSEAPNNLVLRVFDLCDRTLFQATVSGVTTGSTWSTNLPAGIDGRIVRFGLEGGQTNGAGDFRTIISEVHVFGDPSPARGPVSLSAGGTVSQTSTNTDPSLAIDGNPSTRSETLDEVDGYWIMTLDRAQPIQRVEILSANDSVSSVRLQGLTFRILNDLSNSIASTTFTDPGAGNMIVYTPPSNTVGRYIRIGLEGGAVNGFGDHIIPLAEVSVLTATNVAVGAVSYMTRNSDTLPPASNGNDGSYSTATSTFLSTPDSYWEVDLGQTRALYSVRTVAADGLQTNLTHATISVFNEAYDLVFTQHLAGGSEIFDVALPAPVLGRYVRVGLEFKERTNPSGGTGWQIGIKELQAFGRASNEVGLLSFTSTNTQILAGGSTQLSWQEEDLYRLNLFPNIGSVGSNTATTGLGTRTVSPAGSTEYVLVGSNYNGNFVQHLTINVNSSNLPARISEFVAENKFSLRDGNKSFEDWIELHNPNNTSLNLSGYGLSDNPATPMKWIFPANTIVPPHGYLAVFADGRDETDVAGFLHTSFSLNKDFGSVVLTASNGVTTVDAVTNYPPQTEDLAYGRTLDGQWKFLEPTPLAANAATAYEGWLAPLDFSDKRGWYSNAFSLFITNSNPSSDVFWSMDGVEPTNLYTGPLSITNTAGVRASVQRAGYKPPRTKTHTYLFLDGIINSPVINAIYTQPAYTNRLRQGFVDLPVFSINVPPATAGALGANYERPEREASMEIFMPDGSDIQENCGLIHFGGAFGTGTGNPYAKKSWQLGFRSRYGASKLKFPLFEGFDHGLLARDTFNELDLHGGNHDMSSRGFYISHRFAADTMLEMGNLNPHGRFVHLLINGVYMGQFDAHERLTDSFLAEYMGGAKEDYLTVKGNDNTGTFGFIPGVPDPPDRAAWETVRSNRTSYLAVKDGLDVPNYIDFVLMWQWGNAEAEFRAAGARVESPGRGFKFWLSDADKHVPRTNDVNSSLTKNQTTSVFANGPGFIFGALIAEGHPDFKMLLADRIYKHFFNDGAMTPVRNEARLNLRMAEITNSMVAECARWGSVNGRTPENWEGNAQGVRDNFFPFRNGNLLTYMRNAGWYPPNNPPLFNQFGGSVSNGFTLTLSASATTYYTLDGSDPRLPGGGISSNAIAWSTTQTVVNVVDVPVSSTWRYFNTNDAPPGTWQATNYNDAAWPSGLAPMGYNTSGSQTNDMGVILSFGPVSNNKWRSYYFRKAFTVTNLAGITQMTVKLNRDDGAVVYLNGTELMRDNMPAGPISFTNLALSNVSGTSETNIFRFNVPANLLVTGTNVLACEVHQASTNSSDVHFNLGLAGSVTNFSNPLELVLTNDTLISARVWDGTNWSALAQTSFVLAPLVQPKVGDLVISEIHCNPDGPDDYEFLEVYNLSTNLLDLTGVKLQDGVNFLFPNNFRLAPGAFTLVVEQVGAFTTRYRTPSSPYYHPNLDVAGQWAGALSDGGETVLLVASNGTQLASVSYETGGVWPARADGKGSSLELRSPATMVSTNISTLNANLSYGPNWRSSALYHGSPGRLDTEPRRIAISEVVAHTDVGVDWVELQNTSPDPIDLSSYYVSDQYSQPLRYDFPGGATIPGNSYLVLSATDLGFGFSELGSDTIVLETFGTNILRFADTVDFPAVDREEPFGRYTRSDGIVDFTELRAKTQGTNNALPRIGPVVFSEVMYKPDTNKSEFVEIVNLSQTNVHLYDPARPTNTWTLAGAIQFKFPTNQTLVPGALAIICATNPAEFRLQYGVSPSIAVYGSWTGALNNAGENVRLERPGDPETNGTAPYYRVDRLRYEPVAPWPAGAAAGGVSLERVTLEGYGNDPANWQASIAGGTPGAFDGNRMPNVTVDGDPTVTEGGTVSLTVEGSDLDQPWQTVSLALQNPQPGSTFNPTNGAFSWPTAEQHGPGVYSLRFTATDNGVIPMTCTQIVAVTVLESNLPPSLQPVASFQYPAGTPLTLDLVGADPDLPTQTLSYFASGLPAGLSINLSGRISGTAQTQGAYPVQVSVSDNESPPLAVTNAFTLTLSHPFVTQVALATNKPQFSFWAITGQTYHVQYSTQLNSANWQLLQQLTNVPGGLMTVSNLPAGPRGFMRVLWIR